MTDFHPLLFTSKGLSMKRLILGLHFNNLRGDIYGGTAAAGVALSLALAFEVASGAGVIAGLYGGEGKRKNKRPFWATRKILKRWRGVNDANHRSQNRGPGNMNFSS